MKVMVVGAGMGGLSMALSLHQAVPGFRHVVVRGTGHWIQLDKPDEFNKALDGFLKSI